MVVSDPYAGALLRHRAGLTRSAPRLTACSTATPCKNPSASHSGMANGMPCHAASTTPTCPPRCRTAGAAETSVSRSWRDVTPADPLRKRTDASATTAATATDAAICHARICRRESARISATIDRMSSTTARWWAWLDSMAAVMAATCCASAAACCWWALAWVCSAWVAATSGGRESTGTCTSTRPRPSFRLGSSPATMRRCRVLVLTPRFAAASVSSCHGMGLVDMP